MKKKNIENLIAIFWGFNFIFLLVYAIIISLIDLIKKSKEKIYDDPDYNRQFKILISVPSITLILFLLNSLIIHIANGIFIVSTIIIYQIGILFSVGLILLFPKEIMILFDKKVKGILPSFKQFGFFILIDIGVAILFISTWRILYESVSLFIFNLISMFALSLLVYRYYLVYKMEKSKLQDLMEVEELLEYKSTNYAKLRKNIIQLQEKVNGLIDDKKFEKAIDYLKIIQKKSSQLINISKKMKKRENISEATILLKKTNKKRYIAEREKDFLKIRELQESLSSLQNQDQENQKKIEIELNKLLNKRINSAKKMHMQKDIEKFSEIKKYLKS
ncbi:hypothetical protein [Candidatus Harpocratesius sp.]